MEVILCIYLLFPLFCLPLIWTFAEFSMHLRTDLSGLFKSNQAKKNCKFLSPKITGCLWQGSLSGTLWRRFLLLTWIHESKSEVLGWPFKLESSFRVSITHDGGSRYPDSLVGTSVPAPRFTILGGDREAEKWISHYVRDMFWWEVGITSFENNKKRSPNFVLRNQGRLGRGSLSWVLKTVQFLHNQAYT